MKPSPNIAIIGGGPGGLTAAVILHKAGWNVRVFEADASEHARSQGGTLDLHADSGQVALERAGLLHEFRSIARHEDQGTRSINWQTGSTLPAVPRDDSGADRPEIDRGVLRGMLLRALPEELMEWNSALTSVEQNEDGSFTLYFRDRLSHVADVVIGADGAWSVVRQYLTAAEPIYTGVTFMEGWIEDPTPEQAGLVGNGSMFSFGPSQVLVAQKNGRGRICVYAALKQPKDLLRRRLERDSANVVVEEAFQDWAAPLRSLISACRKFVPRSINHLPLGFGWPQQDSITLVGDAAHLMPPLGVGVNLAMLDASDVALAITEGSDLRESIRNSELKVRVRGGELMTQTISAFDEWFASEGEPLIEKGHDSSSVDW
ncbi:NAD(P)/FAD-dependent oxidoreductase [Acidipila sp. EB88]|uniref:FAD-dependent oxidoreductase n=1 Tax=Acidipila sp. EB88 TaxID=2305226 RepID=UPI000F5DD14E|nr:NAD(P)/FAD-dependent oxidoreductase [Acidipila sp. EB88]RRA49317.1 FAD-binding protein [Acidipila sp. EB88]